MLDTALGPPPEAPRGEDWRSGLTRWAVGVRAAYRRHPWALRVPISSPPLGPNNVAWLENALVALRPTPLIEHGDFPALEDAIASGVLGDEDDPDSEFQFGLERILDGVAALIQRHG